MGRWGGDWGICLGGGGIVTVIGQDGLRVAIALEVCAAVILNFSCPLRWDAMEFDFSSVRHPTSCADSRLLGRRPVYLLGHGERPLRSGGQDANKEREYSFILYFLF